MPRPTITYNASSGSDTQASGAGPATAVYGSNNAYSGDGAGGGTQTEITLGGSPDLSGVSTDGSHALWLNTASGDRHLFRITAVNDGTDVVTVHTAPDNPVNTGSEVSWAIGGKRQTLENDTSQEDWLDVESGWTFELEAGTYTISNSIQLAGSIGDSTDGPFTLTSSDPGVVTPVIDRTGNFDSFKGSASGSIVVDGIKFTRSSGSNTAYHALSLPSQDTCIVRRCVIDGTGMGNGINISGGGCFVLECDIYNCNRGIYSTSSYYLLEITMNSIHGNTLSGIRLGNSSPSPIDISCNLIYNNGDMGIEGYSLSGTHVYKQNTIYGNVSDGIGLTDSSANDNYMAIIEENSMSENGGYGINVHANQIPCIRINRNNHYYNNTSGDRNNLSAGVNDTSGDPLFASITGTEDFTPDSGSPLIDAGIASPTN